LNVQTLEQAGYFKQGPHIIGRPQTRQEHTNHLILKMSSNIYMLY